MSAARDDPKLVPGITSAIRFAYTLGIIASYSPEDHERRRFDTEVVGGRLTAIQTLQHDGPLPPRDPHALTFAIFWRISSWWASKYSGRGAEQFTVWRNNSTGKRRIVWAQKHRHPAQIRAEAVRARNEDESSTRLG
jgi:hypothetical protein